MDSDVSSYGLSRKFDDPFLLPSSQSMPEHLETALDYSMFLYWLNPQYRQASTRVVSHFITDFNYPGDGSEKEKEDFDDFVHDGLKLPGYLNLVGRNERCYGNSFCRIHFPFDRLLIDPRTPAEYSLSAFGRQAKFHWQKMQYEIPDPKNKGKKVFLSFRDYPSLDINRIKLLMVNPRRVMIRYSKISAEKSFVYRFEPEIIDDVKKGRRHMVDSMPMDMLKAIRHNQDFLFAPDQIYHFLEPTIEGVSNHGWGLPPVIANYRNIHQLQVYRKIDEAIGLDYLLPFRLFAPVAQANQNDVFNNLLLGRWTKEIDTIIRNRRRDKFAMHALPFPVTYQEFGAEGKELVPKDLIDWQTNALLDGMGYPQELFKGSLQYQQMPTALRLFESSFDFMHSGFDQLSKWIVDRVRRYLRMSKMSIALQEPSIADSLENMQLATQLMAQGEISRESIFKKLGIRDVKAEVEQRIEEDTNIQELKTKAQNELQKKIETGTLTSGDQQQGGAGGGSAPGAPGAGGSQTPMDTANEADSLAQYWMSIPADGERAKAMAATRASNENLWALAKAKMEQTRSQGASQGRQAANQQAQQAGPPSGGTTNVAG